MDQEYAMLTLKTSLGVKAGERKGWEWNANEKKM